MKKIFKFFSVWLIITTHAMEQKNNQSFYLYRELSEAAANNRSQVIYNWQAHLTRMTWHANATREQNQQHTTQAIKNAESLFNFTCQTCPRYKEHIAQKLKDDFSCTIFKQPQQNGKSIALENIKLFNDAITLLLKDAK